MLRNTNASLSSKHSWKSSAQLPWDQLLLMKRDSSPKMKVHPCCVSVTMHFHSIFFHIVTDIVLLLYAESRKSYVFENTWN